jgi:HlyD family secretion protein
VKIRKRWFWIGGVILLVIFFAAALLRPEKSLTVQTAKAERKNLVALVKAPGTIEPQTMVNISAEVPGKIIELAVREGDVVEQGQLLLRLDDANYRAQVAQARALLASAHARYRSAETTYNSAKPTYERRKSLYARKLLSDGEMEDAEREYMGALSEYESAREDIGRQEAALAAARDQLAKTVYRSPIDGTVIERNVEKGEIVVVGTMNNPGTRILAVGDLERMLVKAEVDETDVVEVQLDQGAKIEVDALPDTSFGGQVTEIGRSARRSGTAAAGETNFEVKILFDEKVEKVLPGMTADVEIETAAVESTLAVPIQCVVVRSQEDLEEADRGKRRPRRERNEENEESEEGGNSEANEEAKEEKPREFTGVFVLIDGRAEFRKVATGIASDTDIEVSGGLEPGDEVITGPYNVLRGLKPGEKVKAEKGKGRRRGR